MRSRKPDRLVADFDSAAGMLRALSRFLAGHDVPLLGRFPGRLEPAFTALFGAASHLPDAWKERAYAVSGWAEAFPAEQTAGVRSDALAEWAVGHYPKRRYPVVFIGSSNGAAIHLAAALGAPWLPQTLLLPVRRRGGAPDEPAEALRVHRPAGERLLEANPDLELHHMHDANQDRLMVAGMSYFRVKWRGLPEPYRRFLREHLAPGGTVVTVECGLHWPTTQVADRYFFQHGALGGATPEEFRYGSPRVADYLRRYGSHRRNWEAPEPDDERPEAEWGFVSSLLPELVDFTEQHGLRLARLQFDEPEDLSPAVADLHRDWYAGVGLPTDRLLVESFLLLEPWWTLRTGSVPYWAVFNTEPSRRRLLSYLDEADPYDEIRLTLFSHGVESVGLASIDGWRQALRHARKVGAFVGVDPAAYPRDFAVFVRFHRELARIRDVHPLPLSLDLPTAEDFLAKRPGLTYLTPGGSSDPGESPPPR